MKNFNLIKRLWTDSHEKQRVRGMRRYATMITLLLTLACGNVWANLGSTEIIKNTITAQTTCSVTGTMAGSGAVNSLGSKSPYKLNSDGAYVSLVLSAGNYYAAGDSIVVDADKAIQIYIGTAGSGSLLATTDKPIGGTVVYVLPSTLPSNTSSIYVYRASSTYNASLTYVSVRRPNWSATGSGKMGFGLTVASSSINHWSAGGLTTLSGGSSSFTTSNLSIGSSNSKDGYCGAISGQKVAEDATYYVSLGFSVEDGYTFNPTALGITLQASSADMRAKVEISDGETTVTSNVWSASSNTDAAITFASGAFTDKLFSGDVTIKFYSYNKTGARIYIKSPITISGTVAAAAAGPTLGSYYYRGSDNEWGATQMYLSTGELYEYYEATSSTNTFKIAASSSAWDYNDSYIKSGYCMTNLSVASDGTNDNNSKITSAPASYYIIVFKPSTRLNRSSSPVICASTTLPDDSSEGLTATKTIYLKPGTNWSGSSAKFAINYNGHGVTADHEWSSFMTLAPCETDVYKVDIPALYSNIIICRINSDAESLTTGDFSKKWNQTEDLVIPQGSDYFTVANDAWDGSTTTWSTYSAPTYTVTYNANGDGAGNATGTTGSVPTDASSPYACGSTVTVLGNTGSLAKSGYTFAGWNTAPGGGGTSYVADATFTISANTVLYAQWEEIKYTVTYNVNGGGSVTPTSATQASSGASVTLPTPTWSGYTFEGWYNAGTKIGNAGASYTPTANITLYAHWTDNISGKVFSFIDNNYGDKFKSFTGYGWVARDSTGRNKTFTNASTGVQYTISAGCWDKKDNAISALAKFKGGTSSMSIVIPTGKIATVKISYNAYGTAEDYRLTVNGSAQAAPSTKLADGNTNAQVISNMKEITLNNQTGTLTLGIRNTSKNNYIGRVSAVITGYTVSYAAGTYGTGSLASGTKTHGSNFTLSSADDAFTRDGYVYDGWSVNADGSTKDYNLGGSYTTDAAITLYPHWVAACTAPSALAASSPTAKGVTLTVTDGEDTENYEFYVSEDEDEPAANATGTHSVSSAKSLTITNLVAGTTYYAWARSVCGVSNKSSWVALTDDTFTTLTVGASYTLTNVTKSSGATTGIGGSDFTAVFAGATDYNIPSTITVTIDGNTATSGTDYTWAQATGTLTIPANKINGNITVTVNSAAAAPTQVDISGGYHYYPGETISLTATPTGGNGPKTYQWYHGGTADGNAIDGATSATYSKSKCVVGDAGSYYCKVTCGGSASRFSDGANQDQFKVKIMQFYLKDASGDDISNHALVKGVDADHASLSLSLTGGTTYKFRVTDGCGDWYGNSGEMTSSNCTDWAMDADADCRITTSSKSATYTFNFDFTDGLLGSEMKVSVVYPAGNQASGKVIYWDNSVLEWASAPWYRIGKSTHNTKTEMDRVPGTANLYTVTTAEYNGFEYWHIANNQGQGTGNIFWTKDNSEGSPDEITNAMGFEGSPVTADAITVTPSTSHGTGGSSDNNNCEFYEYGQQNGMKTDRVTISDYSNGTITVNYTNTSNVASSFTSGYADLAHTVKLTSITAVANTGYDAGAITINGGAYSANYVVTGATTIAASFTLHNYNVTYNTPSNGNYTIKVASGSASSASKTATMGQTITLAATPSTGYHFTGWTITNTDNSTDITNSVSLSGQTENATFTMPAANISIVATFAINTYTVSFAASPAGYGSVSPTSIASVNHGSTVSIASNVLTLKATNVTATPTSAGADYTYSFSGWSVSNGASITEAQTITANFTRTANQYSVTHTLTGVTTSSGATGSNAATYGTNYSATFAASSGYELPSSVTVTAGGSDITASCTYTKATGTVVIPGASITGNIVITVTGTYAANFQMIANSSAASDATLANNESISQGSKNCATLTGGTAVYSNADGDSKSMKVAKPSSGTQYGWYFNVAKDVITITLTSHVLQVGSVITFSGYVGSADYGISVNGSTTLTKSGSSGEFTKSYTVTAGDTHLIGKNVLELKRESGSAKMYSFTLSNCQAATPCTTPTLPSLSNQAGCSYSAWNATPSNASTISAAGESISYSWKKGATEKATTASYTPDADGTDYTVTVTVSKAGKISTSVTSSALTATKYGNPTVTGPSSDAEYEVGDVATNLSVTATPDHGESLTYQWYSNTAKSTSSPTPTALENCTTSTYKPSTAAAATTYYFCKVSGGCADVYSSIATVTVNEASCFKVSDATKKSMSDSRPSGTVITDAMINGTITGGTLTYMSRSGGTISGNSSKGLIFDNINDTLVVQLAEGHVFGAGGTITITSCGASASTYGFTVSGNSMTPASLSSGTDVGSGSQSYTITAGDGIAGRSKFNIVRVSTSSINTYLYTIKVTGCEDCNEITPSLSYSKSTFWMDDAVLTATPTLTGYYGTPTISYASSDPTVVRVDNSSTGAITALKRGTATITATIGATTVSTTDYCGNTATCDIKVKDMSCGYTEIASAVLTSKTAATTVNATLLASNMSNSSAPYKLDKTLPSYFGLQLSSGNFQVGDSVIFKVKINDMNISGYDDYPVAFYHTTDTSSYTPATAIYIARPNTKNTDNVYIRFIITKSMIDAGLTNKILIIRSGRVTQNHSMYEARIKRYTCPDIYVYDDASGDGLWSEEDNWIGATGHGSGLPRIDDRVVITKPITVDIAHATAAAVILDQSDSKTGQLTIQPNKGLEVAGTIRKTTDGSAYSATGEADLVLESNEDGNASLIFDNSDEENLNQATVQMYSKAGIDGSTWNWQYVGTPFTGSIPLYNYYGSWMYKWYNGGWTVVKGSDELTPFVGYCLTQESATTHVMGGTLVPTTSKSVDMAASTDMVLANSWTAPIYIGGFTASTFTSTPATIYLFNTGSAEDGASEYVSGEEAGTYVTVPVNAAEYTGNEFIAPMQGFFVTTNGKGGKEGAITMNYNDLVRPAGEHTDIVAGPMKAPRRAQEADDKPAVLKMWANGSEYNDRVVILEREDFSEGFDNGWDGEKMSFGSESPSVYVINEQGGYDAVSAIPSFEGTVVGFRAGANNSCTLTFDYDGEETLYLNDLQAQQSTLIDKAQTYTFSTSSYDSEARFIISATPITKITTGIENDANDVNDGMMKVRKIIINDKLFIIRGGRMYDATGIMVK